MLPLHKQENKNLYMACLVNKMYVNAHQKQLPSYTHYICCKSMTESSHQFRLSTVNLRDE